MAGLNTTGEFCNKMMSMAMGMNGFGGNKDMCLIWIFEWATLDEEVWHLPARTMPRRDGVVANQQPAFVDTHAAAVCRLQHTYAAAVAGSFLIGVLTEYAR